jgi:hypothetical protein
MSGTDAAHRLPITEGVNLSWYQIKPTSMKINEILQKDVQDAIKWEPQPSTVEIGVTAKGDVTTPTETVNSYARKQKRKRLQKMEVA